MVYPPVFSPEQGTPVMAIHNPFKDDPLPDHHITRLVEFVVAHPEIDATGAAHLNYALWAVGQGIVPHQAALDAGVAPALLDAAIDAGLVGLVPDTPMQ